MPSPIVQRFTRERKEGETVAEYVATLRSIGEHCNFGNSLEDMIRDRLVCGVGDKRILLQEKELTSQSEFHRNIVLFLSELKHSRISLLLGQGTREEAIKKKKKINVRYEIAQGMETVVKDMQNLQQFQPTQPQQVKQS